MDTMGMAPEAMKPAEASPEISGQMIAPINAATNAAINAPTNAATGSATHATERSAAEEASELSDSSGDLSCDSIFGYHPDSEITSANPADHAPAQPVTYVTQSRFFTPLFNAAIFDGPIRIYFAQHQEPQAMKLYFNLQERYGDLRQQARDVFRERGSNIFVMLYPDVATFEHSFGFEFDESSDLKSGNVLGSGSGAEAGAKSTPSSMSKVATGAVVPQTILTDRMGGDYVVGVRGPVLDNSFDALCAQMEKIIRLA